MSVIVDNNGSQNIDRLEYNSSLSYVQFNRIYQAFVNLIADLPSQTPTGLYANNSYVNAKRASFSSVTIAVNVEVAGSNLYPCDNRGHTYEFRTLPGTWRSISPYGSEGGLFHRIA